MASHAPCAAHAALCTRAPCAGTRPRSSCRSGRHRRRRWRGRWPRSRAIRRCARAPCWCASPGLSCMHHCMRGVGPDEGKCTGKCACARAPCRCVPYPFFVCFRVCRPAGSSCQRDGSGRGSSRHGLWCSSHVRRARPAHVSFLCFLSAWRPFFASVSPSWPACPALWQAYE